MLRRGASPGRPPRRSTGAQDATRNEKGITGMDDYTKQRIQEIGDEIREGVKARGLQVGTPEAEAWVRANIPAGEFWAFVAAPDADQRQAALEAGS